MGWTLKKIDLPDGTTECVETYVDPYEDDVYDTRDEYELDERIREKLKQERGW